MPYDNRNSGVLFRNKDKKTEKQPDYTGKLDCDGTEYRIAAWRRVPKGGGEPFLSIKRSDPNEQRPQGGSKGDNGFFDD